MKTRFHCAVVFSAAVSFAPAAFAQLCKDWAAGPLSATQPTNGIGDWLTCVVNWDPDGAGPLSPLLVVGGDLGQGFTSDGIAAWDAAAGTWRDLADTNGAPVALAVYNSQLVAGGYFISIGASSSNRIARFDGTNWLSVSGGSTRDIHSLAVYNSELIAGGGWLPNDGSANFFINRWTLANGWQPLGSGIDGLFVDSMASFNGELVVGGWFTNAAGNPNADYIAKWSLANGWTALGTGMNSQVLAMTVYSSQLIAAGYFTIAGGQGASHIARWNGSVWQTLGAGLDDDVDCLAVYNGELIAGGTFTHAGGVAANRIARWNGSTWQALGQGIDGQVNGLAVYNGQLAAVGKFGFAGGAAANNVAMWNGSAWSPILAGNQLAGAYTIANFTSKVVVGGDFHQVASVGQAANNIVTFNGVAMGPLGTGMNAAVDSLKVFKYPGAFGNTEMIAGGMFTVAGGFSANHIARWTENPIVAFPPPAWAAMGSGFNDTVYAIERYNDPGGLSTDETYAAGAFTFSGASAVSRIAKWNETNDTWGPSGAGGMNDVVYALKVFNGSLYAGGQFTTAGGSSTGGLARWNGSSWTQVGGNFSGIVLALEVHDNQLVIGGIYPGLPNTPNLAKYDGTNYTTIGTGGTNAAVWSLKSSNGNLYVGGDFTTIAGNNAKHIAVWNGTWASGSWGGEVQGGASNNVYAMTSYHDEIHAVGLFGIAGTVTSPDWARYHETGVPWIVYQPASLTLACGQDAHFTAYPSTGYTGLNYLWRKNGAPVQYGPNGTGSIITSSGPYLDIYNCSSADVGTYDMVLSNTCGTATSFTATLDINGPCAPCPADITHDRVINVDDLLAVINGWGRCHVSLCWADIAPVPPNGNVNVDDLLKVISNWGPCP